MKVKKQQRVAIAFSGGGVRAASFASGLLWALAEKGVMKHVSHLSAVSGVAAYAYLHAQYPRLGPRAHSKDSRSTTSFGQEKRAYPPAQNQYMQEKFLGN